MTSTNAPTLNGTPTGELPLVPSPTPRAAVQAAAAEAPDTMITRIKRLQAERAADVVEQYCSTYRAGKHRAGDRPRHERLASEWLKPGIDRQPSHAAPEGRA